MRKRRGRRSAPPPAEQFTRVVGHPLSVDLEKARRASRIDHVWIMLDVPGAGRLRLAINTCSLKNERAGFDGRVRMARIRETCDRLPDVGLFPCEGLDYAAFEAENRAAFEIIERPALEQLLIDLSRAANLIEAWGMLYAHKHVGLHQIHSRRPSCAVPEQLPGRDGAVKFYFPTTDASEMLLFAFCGQIPEPPAALERVMHVSSEPRP